jgi:hypothetical protein
MLIIAPAHTSVLNDVFAWFITPLIAMDMSSSFPPCIQPSRTSKMMKTSSKHCIMVQYLVPLQFSQRAGVAFLTSYALLARNESMLLLLGLVAGKDLEPYALDADH